MLSLCKEHLESSHRLLQTDKKKKRKTFFFHLGIIKFYKVFACFDVTNNINMFITVDFFLTVIPVFKPDRKKPACSRFKFMQKIIF